MVACAAYDALKLSKLYITLHYITVADVVNTDVRAYVGVHVDHGAVGVRTVERGRRRQGASRERQIRLPRRVDDHRLHEPETALRHDEDRRQPRLEGLRRRYSARLGSQVRIFHVDLGVAEF